MTASAARRRIRRPEDRLTIAGHWLLQIQERRKAANRITFPSTRYQEDPVAFFREILGVEPWEKQVEILEAVRDHPRVAVASGHKVSKSHSAAGLALWYYCSFPDARCVMSSTTSRQVDQILWRELRMMRARGGRCLDCKAEDPEGRTIPRPCPHSSLIDAVTEGELARTGLKSKDFREIVGFTAREAEAVAGTSGRNLMYIIDEASGVGDDIFEAIEGNRAGGARIVLFSNPTRTSGEFFEAFHGKSQFYVTLCVSSEETPNVVQGKTVIPGLATREWIDEKKEEWGEDSPLYKVRVRGEFALNEDGKIFSIHLIEQAQQRWHETPESGRLFIGLDPAGPSGSGDETVYAVRRGLKLIELVSHRGLNDEAHLVHLLSLLNKHRLPRETPVVVLDREGAIGASLYGLVKNYHDGNRKQFEFVAVKSSGKAVRQPIVYDRIRDELAANLEAWFRDGGSILEDAKLEAELHEPEWEQQANGKLKLTPKDKLKKELGRSPDRFDALSMAVWEPLSLREGAPPRERREDVQEEHPEQALDPYAAADAWGGR